MSLDELLAIQDWVITRRQALVYFTQDEIASRLGKRWRVLLAGTYLCSADLPTPRQRRRAALLHAGPTAMLADTTALADYGVPYVPTDAHIRVLVADHVQRVSRDFVVVRRSARLPKPVMVRGLPMVPIDRAVCEFAARTPGDRDALAVAAAAVQLRQVDINDLMVEAMAGPSRGVLVCSARWSPSRQEFAPHRRRTSVDGRCVGRTFQRFSTTV